MNLDCRTLQDPILVRGLDYGLKGVEYVLERINGSRI